MQEKTKPHEHVDETEETARRQSRGNDMIETNDDEKTKEKKKKTRHASVFVSWQPGERRHRRLPL